MFLPGIGDYNGKTGISGTQAGSEKDRQRKNNIVFIMNWV